MIATFKLFYNTIAACQRPVGPLLSNKCMYVSNRHKELLWRAIKTVSVYLNMAVSRRRFYKAEGGGVWLVDWSQFTAQTVEFVLQRYSVGLANLQFWRQTLHVSFECCYRLRLQPNKNEPREPVQQLSILQGVLIKSDPNSASSLLCGPLCVAISWNGADVCLSVCLSVCHVSYLENGAR